MSRIKILTPAEKKAFDTPPIFSADERDEFFKLDETLSSIINQLSSPTNQVGFLLQFGYFKATGHFFTAMHFSSDDIAYVKKLLALTDKEINLYQYKERTLKRHQERICCYFHYTLLDNEQKVKLKEKINDYVMKCVQPKKIIFSIVQQYRYEKIVLPSFNTLCHLITEAYNQYEFSLLSIYITRHEIARLH